jgi:tetratricopeptide (TPR) repeat protein
MFEFSRELRRLFAPEGPKDGLTGGVRPLLELLDLGLLKGEARAADIAAGRISAKDPAQRTLEAARVWREVARRTGDPIALRKAAASAESAAGKFDEQGRVRDWGLARLEQALAAIDGADLFGDEGLSAAAEYALEETRRKAPGSVAAALAAGRLARLKSEAFLRGGDASAVLDAASTFDAAIAALEPMTRVVHRTQLAELRCDKAELLLAGAQRLSDVHLAERALAVIDRAMARLDQAYEPLTWARAQELKGATLITLGESRGELDVLTDGVNAYADALEMVGPDHSPMDWARLQHGLALGLRALGEAAANDLAFDQALACFDRALWALKDQPAAALSAVAASNRAACLARKAELTGDLGTIDEAVEALKAELRALSPGRDPVSWAVAQVNLARLYETRIALNADAPGEAAAAALALDAALEVFGEQGQRTLADEAARAIARLAARNRSAA